MSNGFRKKRTKTKVYFVVLMFFLTNISELFTFFRGELFTCLVAFYMDDKCLLNLNKK